MNTDLINRLKTGIYASDEGRDLAAHIVQLIERDYHTETAEFSIRTTNLALGEVARALAVNVVSPDGLTPYYFIVLWPTDGVCVRVKGPYMAPKFEEI